MINHEKKTLLTFFRPIIEESCYWKKDDHIYAVISYFQLKMSLKRVLILSCSNNTRYFEMNKKINTMYDHILCLYYSFSIASIILKQLHTIYIPPTIMSKRS